MKKRGAAIRSAVRRGGMVPLGMLLVLENGGVSSAFQPVGLAVRRQPLVPSRCNLPSNEVHFSHSVLSKSSQSGGVLSAQKEGGESSDAEGDSITQTTAPSSVSSSDGAAVSHIVGGLGSEGINGQKPVHDHITRADQAVMSAAVAAVILSFLAVVKISGPGAWRYYTAGGICAAVSHGITTPIDVVKTRQQVDPKLKEKGMVKSTLKIIKNDGIGALLAGLGPTTFGYLFEGAIKFGVYEVLKPCVRKALVWAAAVTSVSALDSKILGFVLCGGASGVAASAMLCPMEALRIRLVAEPDFAPKGWVDGLVRMLKYEGVGGLWKGMSAMMCKQVPYTVTKNVSFDLITTWAYRTVAAWGFALTARMKLTIPLVSAMIASVLSCVSSQPGDMLLSAVNAHEGDRTVRDFAREIMEEDGVKGFFRGIQARFLHVGLIVTVQLMIYDIVKRLVGIAATGST